MKYIPLLLYSFRWNIETSYYEQKTFWSFCNYMVRSCKGIEMLVNLINISYCAMKILPYQNEHFSEYRTKSVQEFRFELSQGIRSQIFFATFVKNIETHIKSNAMTKALKQLIHPPNNYSNKINYLISGTFFCINCQYKHQRIQCISWILHINNICISHMKQFFTNPCN